MSSNQGLGNVDDIRNYLDAATGVQSGADAPQGPTTDPEKAFYDLFMSLFNSSTVPIHINGSGGIADMNVSMLDLFALFGDDPEVVVTYTENFYSGTSSMTLDEIAEFFNASQLKAGLSTFPPMVVDMSNPTGQRITTWWSEQSAKLVAAGKAPLPTLYNSGQTPPERLDMRGIINALTTAQLITVTDSIPVTPGSPVPSITPQGNTTRFQTQMALFMQNYSNSGGIEPMTPNNFVRSFLAYMANNKNKPPGFPDVIPIRFVSSSGSSTFGYPESYYFMQVPEGSVPASPSAKTYVGMPVPTIYTVTNAFTGNVETTTAQVVQKLRNMFNTQLSLGNDTWFEDLTSDQKEVLFINTFSTFTSYLTDSSEKFALDDDFFKDWSSYIGPLAVLSYPNGVGVPTNTISYQKVWDTFFPNDPAGFLPAVTSFVNLRVGVSGGFTPSTMLGDWAKTLRAATLGPLGGKMLEEAGFDQIQVLFKIYDLLIKMLGQFQTLAAAQLNRQTFYQHYQAAYTERANELAKLTVTGTTTIDGIKGYGSGNGPNAAAIQRRSEISQLQSQYTESIKSYRSQISDISQQFGSSVNQSQQAVSQQLNVAQTLLQQFSSLMQSIWR